jgi:hypothetical protein
MSGAAIIIENADYQVLDRWAPRMQRLEIGAEE